MSSTKQARAKSSAISDSNSAGRGRVSPADDVLMPASLVVDERLARRRSGTDAPRQVQAAGRPAGHVVDDDGLFKYSEVCCRVCNGRLACMSVRGRPATYRSRRVDFRGSRRASL